MGAIDVDDGTRDRWHGVVQSDPNLFHSISVYGDTSLFWVGRNCRQIQDQAIRIRHDGDFWIYRVGERDLEPYFFAGPNELYFPDCCCVAPLRHARGRQEQ
jgi:hypothetical protein